MKNIFKALLLITLASVSITACSKDDGGDKKTDGGKLVDITDRSLCSGATPAGLDIYRDWTSDQQAGDIRMHFVFSFSGQEVTVYNTCTQGDISVTAQVSAPVRITATSVEILAADQSEATGQDNSGHKVTCNVSVSARKTLYDFKGQCLELTGDPGQPNLVLPLANPRN